MSSAARSSEENENWGVLVTHENLGDGREHVSPWVVSRNANWLPLRSELIMNEKTQGLPWCLSGKESACNAGAAGHVGSIPGSERFPQEGHGNWLQCSSLENPIDRGGWQATVHRITKNRTQLKQLSTHKQIECTTCMWSALVLKRSDKEEGMVRLHY